MLAVGVKRLMTISLQSLKSAAKLMSRFVVVSTPVWALITTAAVSTPGNTLMARPMKSGLPGVSMMFMNTPSCSRWQTALSSECWRRFSCGLKSEMVFPLATVPGSRIIPVRASMASRSVVLPLPAEPTSAMLRTCRVS